MFTPALAANFIRSKMPGGGLSLICALPRILFAKEVHLLPSKSYSCTMEGETHFQELVRWAEERLREQIATVDCIRNDIGLAPSDEQILEHVDRLETTRAASEMVARAFENHQKPLLEHDLGVAFQKGLAPGGKPHPRRDSYVALLDVFLEACRFDRDQFDALSLHAAGYVEMGSPMPYEIRRFIAAYLKGDLKRPSVKGAPRKGDR
ncbi:hypothetical protein HC022_11295 [Salipiger sp. HF18]|uniref:hypothetical protein n=1 Tax=Salipiger sp. HF18 TaxID=2721557 RepID=UPI00142D4FA1|nr:hypothetical protein [Salipiger sp. HF18]NIY96799.1 hypothetical protein [Salipiger sp. HF18]